MLMEAIGMPDELESLRRYMNEGSTTYDLSVANTRLSSAIAEESVSPKAGFPGPKGENRWRRKPPRRLLVAGAIFSSAAAALLVLTLLPVPGQHQGEAVAAQLHTIATNAASSQAESQIQAGQFLETKLQASFSLGLTHVGLTQAQGSRGSVVETITEWSNDSGGSCMLALPSVFEFPSSIGPAVQRSAGSPLGLQMPKGPDGQPVNYCSGDSSGGGNTLDYGNGTIDVSGLPTDPTTLAEELQNGTTGIAAIDRLSLDSTSSGQSDGGFERATLLLIGPVSGSTPAFVSALYNALSKIPGISSLGVMRSHSGLVGLGFSGESLAGTSDIIVDPTSGALLEARNLASVSGVRGLGPDTMLALLPSIPSDVGWSQATIQWVDPIGSPTVVGPSSLPSGAIVPEG
jgi:hypothetical protein